MKVPHIGSADEIAFCNTWISKAVLRKRAELISKKYYGRFLARLAEARVLLGGIVRD